MDKANSGGARRLRGPRGETLYCVNEACPVLRDNTDGSHTGQGCSVGWRGHDLYSSSVSWPLAEVLSVRKGTLGYRSGSNCPGGVTRDGWTGRLKGPGPNSMLHLERNCPLLTPAQFGFGGAIFRNIISTAPSSTPSLPLLGRQEPSLVSIHRSLNQSFILRMEGKSGPE